jgi:hypothetical protein
MATRVPLYLDFEEGQLREIAATDLMAFNVTGATGDYTGQAGKFIRVALSSDVLEFVTIAGGGDMLGANNLSDVASAATSRANLGLNTTANQTDSTNKRFVTDADLVDIGNLSGTNTGDQTSIVGISGTKAQFDTACSDGNFMYIGDAPTAHTHPQSDVTNLVTDLSNKQATLVSGTNIKTINGSTLLGSGDLTVSAGDLSYSPGSFTIVTETAKILCNKLKLTTTQRLTIEGTGRLSIIT